MNWNRRDFITVSSVGLVSALGGRSLFAQAPAAPQAPTVPKFKDVRRNVGIFTARGGTIGYLVTPDAVIVVDSQFADTAPMFLEGLKPKTSRKIDFLINSHHHPRPHGRQQGDAAVGGEDRRARQRARACSASRPRRRRAKPTRRTPTRRSRRTGRRRVGKETVSARYYGPAHTGGDIVITFENANVVHMGDLMSFQRNPRADRPAGASIVNWVPVLENTVKDHSNDTIYIFGHSKVGERVTGSSKDLLELRDYFTAMLDFTRKAIASGRSMEEIVKTTAIPGFERYEGTPTALQAAYEELTAKT